MDKKTKLTLEELVRRKAQILEAKGKQKKEELYIESLDGTITITAPTRAVIMDAQGFDEASEADAYFVLNLVTDPPLTQVAKEYGVAEPTDIVDILFTPGEVSQIAQRGLDLAGYNTDGVRPVKEIKN